MYVLKKNIYIDIIKLIFIEKKNAISKIFNIQP